MASIFSTATLGLKVDVKQFNKAIAGTGLATNEVLRSMALSAADFEARLDSATAGLKDTKRIISGILVSRGFYSLLEGLTAGADAALTFSRNMETAAISVEYFMQGANKATKALAYIETMKEFAARTPFDTESALAMSKYIQSMGISANVVKSYLTVVTDAAAATGATTENLQRVTLALGQIMTKGRLANEEIRQLANANIPIYAILQEELKLTGEEISDIGRRWVAADKSVVAILRGLEKRYKGAGDRIAESMTGMFDTISDNLRIISSSAGNFLYEGLKLGVTNIRDLLDDYRETITQFGPAGLAKRIMLDIDPTGEFARKIFTTIGNVKRLGTELYGLYKAAQPLINLFGHSLYAAINTATVTLTGFTSIITGVTKALDKLGITSGQLGQILGQLYITYTVGKWMIVLGEGAYYAAAAVYRTVASVAQLFPVSMLAQQGVVSLTASLAGLALGAVAITALVKNLSSLAGLEIGEGATISKDIDAAFDQHEKEMEEWYAAIKEQQESFESPFTDIEGEAEKAKDAIDDVEEASKKAAKKSKQEWLASFDEVFVIPKLEEEAEKIEFPDIMAGLIPPRFKFPSIDVELKEMPTLNMEDMFKAEDDKQAKLMDMLPAAIAAGVVAAIPAIKKHLTPAKFGADPITSTDFEKIYAPDLHKLSDPAYFSKFFGDPTEHFKLTEAYRKTLSEAIDQARLVADDVKKLISADRDALGGARNPALESGVARLEGMDKNLKRLVDQFNKYAELAGSPKVSYAEFADITETKRLAAAYTVEKQIASIDANIAALRNAPDTTAGQLNELISARGALLKQFKKLTDDGVLGSVSLESKTKEELKSMLRDSVDSFTKQFEEAFGMPYTKGASLKHFNIDASMRAYQQFIEIMQIGDKLASFDALKGEALSSAEQVLLLLRVHRDEMERFFEVLVGGTSSLNEIASQYGIAGSSLKDLIGMLDKSLEDVDFKKLPPELRETIRKLQERIIKADDELRKINKELDAFYLGRADTRLEQIKESRKREAAPPIEAAQERKADKTQQQIADNTKATAEATSELADKQAEQLSPIAADKGIKEYSDNRFAEALEELQDIYIKYSAANTSDILKVLEEDIFESVEELKKVGYDTALLTADVGEETASEVLAIHEELSTALPELVQETKQIAPVIEQAAIEIVGASYEVQTAIQHTLEESARLFRTKDLATAKAVLAGYEDTAYYLSGSKMGVVAKGLSDYGEDIPSIAASVHKVNESMAKVAAITPSMPVKIAGALGTRLEDIILQVQAASIDPTIGKLYAGGMLGSDKLPIIVQIDSILQLLKNTEGAFVELANDVKTKSGAAFNELLKGSEEYINGIRRLSIEVLKATAPEHYYQFALQAYAMASGPSAGTYIGMTAFDRDFDFTKVDEALVARWQNAISGMAVPKDITGKIFSTEMLDAYGRHLGLTSPNEIVAAYFKNVVEPIFTRPDGGLDFSPLKYAIQQYVIDYPVEELQKLNIELLADQYYEYNKLLGTVMSSENVGDFVKSYLAFNTEFGERVLELNFANKLRYIPSLADAGSASLQRWLSSISQLTGKSYDFSSAAKSTSAAIRHEVARIINTYVARVSLAASTSEISTLLESTQDSITQLVDSILLYLTDGAVPAEMKHLFKGTTKSKGLTALADALTDVVDFLEAFEELPRVVNSAMEGVAKVNNALLTVDDQNVLDMIDPKTGALSANRIWGIASNVTRAMELLGVSTDRIAQQTIRELEKVYAIAKQLGEASQQGYTVTAAAFKALETVPQIARVLDVVEQLPYAVGTLLRGIVDAELKLTDNAEKAFTRLLDKIDVEQALRLSDISREIVPPRYIFDIEATGLAKFQDGAWEFPNVVQVSLLDTQTKELQTWYANYGEAQNAKNLEAYKAAVKGGESILLEQLNNGKEVAAIFREIADIVGSEPIGGWNAVNFERMGGAYDAKLLEHHASEAALNYATDTYTLFTNKLYELTGRHISMPLGDAIKLTTQKTAEGLHDAAVDVLGTFDVTQALLSDGLKEVAEQAAQAGALTSKGLLEAAETLSKAKLSDATKNITALNNLMDEVLDIGQRASKSGAQADELIGDLMRGLKDILDDEGGFFDPKAFSEMFESASASIGKTWDKAKRNFGKVFKEVQETFSGSTITSATLTNAFVDLDLSGKEVEKAAQALKQLGDALDVAERIPGSREAALLRGAYSDAEAAFNAINKEHAQNVEAFYKQFIAISADAINKYSPDAPNIIELIWGSVDDNQTAKYIATLFDPETKTINRMTETLFSSFEDIQKNIRAYFNEHIIEAMPNLSKDVIEDLTKLSKGAIQASDLGEVSKRIHEALAEVDTFLSTGAKNFNDLSPLAKSLHTAIEQVSGTVPKTLEELTLVINKVLPSATDMLKTANVEVMSYLKGLLSFDDLSETAKIVATTIERVGKNLGVLNADMGEMLYVGEDFAKVALDTAESFSTSFSSFAKKLMFDIFGISIFDVVATAISGVLQHMADQASARDLQNILVNDAVTRDIAETLSAKGIDLGVVMSESFSGVAEVVLQSAINNIVGSIIGWSAGRATTAAIASFAAKAGSATAGAAAGPVGMIAGMVTTVAAAWLIDKVAESMGSRSDTYLYLDDYIKNRDKIIDEATSLGESIGRTTEEAGLVAQEALLLALRKFGPSQGRYFEESITDELLYGDLYADALKRGGSSLGIAGLGIATKQVVASSDEATQRLIERLTVALTTDNDLIGNDLATLGDYVRLVYEHGVTSGDVAQRILGAVGESRDLQAIITEQYPKEAQAIELLGEYLDEFNRQQNTEYSVAEAEMSGLMKELLAFIIKLYDASQAQLHSRVQIEAEYETKNRSLFGTEGGDVASVVWDVDLDTFKSVTQNTFDALNDFGIAVASGTTEWATELAKSIENPAGIIEEAFATVKLSADKLHENIAGWIVDTSKMEFNLGGMKLDAKSVDILAQAGIQINGDGTVTFMKAMNFDVTGDERLFDLEASAFTKDILEALDKYKLTIDFDTSKFRISDYTELEEVLSGAAFKLPDSFTASTSAEMDALIATLGEVLASGYLVIREESVLQGEQTILEYIQGLDNNKDKVKKAFGTILSADQLSEALEDFSIEGTFSDKVLEAFEAIDELIATGTGTITQNIIEWADSIVVPSPIRASQLTEEIRENFQEIGISFEQYGEELLMVINQAGRHISDGITLVDKAKWEELDAEIISNLSEMGVKIIERGNQLEIDLREAFDKNLDEILAIYVNQPDKWEQIPDTFKEYLAKAGVVTQEELLLISNLMQGGLTEAKDGWITTWQSWSDETLDTLILTNDGVKLKLSDLAAVSKEGLLKIEAIIEDDFDFDTLTEDAIVVPFENLPPEIREALLSLNSEIAGKKVVLRDTTSDMMEGMVSALRSGSDQAKAVATDIGSAADMIVSAIDRAFREMNRLQQLQSLAGKSGSFFGIGGTPNQAYIGKDGIGYIYDTKGNIVDTFLSGPNGQWISRRAKGGLASGLTLTGELGRELAILPDGSVRMLGADGKGELADLPPGTRVLNNKDTEDIVKYTGTDKPSISKLASGNVTITDQRKFDEYMSSINDVLKKMSVDIKTQLATYQNTNVSSADAGFMVLNTGAAVYKYATRLGNGTLNLSDAVDSTFSDLNKLIARYETTAEADLVKWANAVVLPSPVKVDEITPEMRAAFSEITRTFNAYSYELNTLVEAANELMIDNVAPESNKELMKAALEEMMDLVISSTDSSFEKLRDTILNNLDKTTEIFLSYTDELQTVLEDTTTIGVESLISILELYVDILEEAFEIVEEVFEAAEEGISDSFDSMYDIYSDNFEEILGVCQAFSEGLIAEFDMQCEAIEATKELIFEIFAQMKLNYEEQFREHADVIIAGVDEVDYTMAELPPIFAEHFMDVTNIFREANIQLTADFNTIKQSINTSIQSIIAEIQSKQGSMQSAVQTMFQGAINAMQDAGNQIQSIGSRIVGNIGSIVSQVQGQVSQLQGLVAQAQALAAQASSAGMSAGTGYFNPAHLIPNVPIFSGIPGYASGGFAAGLSLVGEEGYELALLRDGRMTLLGQEGPQLVNLPSGTRIISNRETEQILGRSVTDSQSAQLQYAQGYQNRAIRNMHNRSQPVVREESISAKVDQIVVRTIESLLPALASSRDNADNRVVAHVGTLIADDRGLRELEKRLEIVRIKEGKRGG